MAFGAQAGVDGGVFHSGTAVKRLFFRAAH